MSVVQNFNQMEEAMRHNELEVLVIGKMAEQIKHICFERDITPMKSDGFQAFLLKQMDQYTIKFRKSARYVPVVLLKKPTDQAIGQIQ